MDYLELYQRLKNTVDPDMGGPTTVDRVTVTSPRFRSRNGWILAGDSPHRCPAHGVALAEPPGPADAHRPGNETLHRDDATVRENLEFPYHLFAPQGGAPAREVILLFNGFNEKHWHKYLPWAHRLVERTGKTVILFPITFHMSRAPAAWSDRRLMRQACEARKRAYPAIIGSTLFNAAISTRLHAMPQRFFWSGLQTYHDVLQLREEIAAGTLPQIAPSATFDLFAYSVGCLLAQILVMTDPKGAFSDARLCLFCGGSVLNRMSPVSRYILDSECDVALYSYAVEHLESHLAANERLRHFLGDEHPEGMNFRSMLNYGRLRKEREARFRQLGRRVQAITLERDEVIPPYEIVNTLQGAARDIPAGVEILDFPHPYRHEDPFPAVESVREAVDTSFRRVFDLAAQFLAPETR